MSNPTPGTAEIVRAERWRIARSWLLGAAVVLPILALIAAVGLRGETREVRGTVLSLHARSTEEGHVRYVAVRLEPDQSVQALLPKGVPFVEGATVRLTEADSLVGGAPRYRVIAYVAE